MSFLLTQHPVAWVIVAVAFLAGYLSGSVPYGLIVSRLGGLGDIRTAGSGNIGATNVLRLGGKKLAAIALLLDILKGFVPVLIARRYHMDYAVLAALGAFLGHLFPVWLKFKGGKGVATAIGVLSALLFPLGLGICGVWLTVFVISRTSSLSALAAFGLAPFMAAFLSRGDYQVTLVTLGIALVIWARHHGNIRRLALGTEGKMNFGKKQGS